MKPLTPTAQRALAAYGGESLWRKSRRIEAVADVTGLAFRLKWRPFFRQIRISMDIHSPRSRITPIGRNSHISGILEGHDVRLEDIQGKTIAERKNARRYFPGGRRLFYWDDLDMAYFANYAFWNYFTLPALLMHQDIVWTEAAAGRLDARFPENIPTHSPQQSFIFDTSTGLLRQHNYTAQVISNLATAANVVHAHAQQEKLVYPSHRIVSPMLKSGKPLGWPKLIEIKIREYGLLP